MFVQSLRCWCWGAHVSRLDQSNITIVDWGGGTIVPLKGRNGLVENQSGEGMEEEHHMKEHDMDTHTSLEEGMDNWKVEV